MRIEHLLGWSFVGLCWWGCVFTYGFFQTIMWSVILAACFGIYITLTEKKI
jgi:uncharacterized membrane protein